MKNILFLFIFCILTSIASDSNNSKVEPNFSVNAFIFQKQYTKELKEFVRQNDLIKELCADGGNLFDIINNIAN